MKAKGKTNGLVIMALSLIIWSASSVGALAGMNIYHEGFLTEGWEYSENASTLTLADYTGTITEPINEKTAQIYSDDDLTIILNGDNTLAAESDYGIYCDGNLTIRGAGSLTIPNSETAIYASKSISIENVEISAGKTSGSNIIANWGDFTSSGADISISGGIYAKNTHDFSITGGSVVTGGGIKSSNASVKNAEVTGGFDCTDKIVFNNSAINANPGGTRKNIKGGRLEMTGSSITQTEGILVSSFEINGSSITSDTTSDVIITVPAEYGSDYNVDSVMTDSTIDAKKATVTFYNYHEVAADIISSQVDVKTLCLEFESTTRSIYDEDGIYVGIGPMGLTIGAGSVVNVNSFGHGWSNRLIIDGGELNVNGDMNFSDDIYTEILEVKSGKLNVDGYVAFYNSEDNSGGYVTITGGESEIKEDLKSNFVEIRGGNTSVGAGVNADSFKFSEGTFEAVNDTQAIVADKIDITGNIKAGRSKDAAKTVDAYSGEKYVYVYGNHIPAEPIKENIKAATCITNGSYDEVILCKNCGAIMERTSRIIPKTGHSYGAWQTTTPATTDHEGVSTRICTKCGDKQTKPIPKLTPSPSTSVAASATPAEIVDLPSVKISKPKAAKKKVTVKWKKPSKKNLKKIQGIEIKVTGPSGEINTTAGKKKTSKKVGGLMSKQRYTVQVRAYAYVGGVKHVSAWKTKTVKTK